MEEGEKQDSAMGGNDKPTLGINPLLMNKTGLSVRIDD